MSESALSFQGLPAVFQQVVQLAQEQRGIVVTPLEQLSGGRSGAHLYLVRVANPKSDQLEHLILKLDRARPKTSSDEVSRHSTVLEISPPVFAEAHIPHLAFDRVQSDEALAMFYTIAGQSLRSVRTLSNFRRQSRIQRLFAATNEMLLDGWNEAMEFEPMAHPCHLLESWLGFRLEPGQKIEAFLHGVCQVPIGSSGLLLRGGLLPNPLHYARDPELWGSIRALDTAIGLQHSDLNTNNILARFGRGSEDLESYYVIDFAMFKRDKPLLYDQRYLEMSYLVENLSDGSFSAGLDLIRHYGEVDFLPADQTPVEMAGVNAAVLAGRRAFEAWVEGNHPSLQDDLWGQYWLAGTAAGLAFCHKAALSDEQRLAGLVFSAANLKRFLHLFDLPLPTEAAQLRIEGPSRKRGVTVSPIGKGAREELPAPLTRFIGREEEVSEVAELLLRPDARLVSLTGPGGTGKTRLALETARGLQEKFSHGVVFIDLSEIRDPSLAIPTAAHTLGIREGGGQPTLEKLKQYLAGREMLLIFDNFEQVVGAGVELSELLEGAPGLKALVTSRVPLQLRGEHEYPVSPLDLPPEAKQALEEAAAYESVALFQQQARAVKPSFAVTEDNQAAVVEICHRLDGLPLAIEIAAARVKLLKPEALLTRLDDRLQFLVSAAKDLPDRHQTLRGTIDWSFQLLQPEVQRLFINLGIFSGGFTLAGAEAVCRELSAIEVMDGVETLLNNSLLRQVPSVTDEPRFDMLQTIRQFALEAADKAGVLEDLQRAHCDYFAELAGGDFGSGIYGVDSVLWLRVYEEEHDNFRQCMTWALENPEERLQRMLAMMTQLSWFWYRYGYLQEGSEWTQRAVAASEGMGDSIPRAFALAGRGFLALWSGDLILAAERTWEAMEMGQRLGMDLIVSVTKMTYGTTLVNRGRDKEAYPYLVDAVELFDEGDLHWMKGTALVHLANVSLGLGDAQQALSWLDTAFPLMNESGDIWNMAFALSNYGEVARAQGDYEKAEELYRRTESLYKQADSKGDQARLITVLGYVAQHKGEFAEAHEMFLESLREFRKLGNPRGLAECLAGLAGLAAELGEHEWGAPLLSAAEARLDEIDGVWWPADRVEIDRAKERLQAGLGEAYEGLWKRGESLTLDEAIAYAVQGWE